MYIKELTVKEFNEFKEENSNYSYKQTNDYALLKSEKDYEYEIIGYVDNNKIYAACIVLVKLINNNIYAYVPDGFIINYNDEELLKNFTKDLIKYYKKDDIVFIKINPNIKIATIDYKKMELVKTKEYNLPLLFQKLGYQKKSNNDEFSSVQPVYEGIIDLKKFKLENLAKNTKNKIRKSIRKGLIFEKAGTNELNIISNFVSKQKKTDAYYYNDYYNIFSRNNSVDYFLVSVDYESYVISSQKAYEKELKKNEHFSNKMRIKPGNKNVNRKMHSDKNLLAYKNDISIASKKLSTTNKEYIAGAIVIKNGNTAYILISGYDKKYQSFVPNYFLYYQLINYYKNEFEYLNIGGLTNIFNKNSKYKGLNDFKLGFKPIVYEYAGEFDLVIKPLTYTKLDKKGLLKKEFHK